MKYRGIFIIACILLITLFLFILAKPRFLEIVQAAPLLSLSQSMALLGTVLFSLSFVLSSRFPFLENLFGGFDKVMKTHQIISALSVIGLLEHPFLLIFSRLPNISLILQYIVPSQELPLTLGIFALNSLIGLILVTLFVDLPYHVWKKTHEFMSVPLIFGILHTISISSDVSRYMPLKIWIYALLGLGSFAFIYRRYLYKFIGPRSTYIISQVNRTGDIVELLMIPKIKPLEIQPGQFVFMSIRSGQMNKEEHPFSVVKTQEYQSEIRIAAKVVGDYTLLLNQLNRGDEVVLWGPYGTFGERFFAPCDVVCIAGGIGI
ncbi:MAG: ferric reductase-like transmembrane domain-containing protein, partial [Patescibacteria group bacterium]